MASGYSARLKKGLKNGVNLRCLEDVSGSFTVGVSLLFHQDSVYIFNKLA